MKTFMMLSLNCCCFLELQTLADAIFEKLATFYTNVLVFQKGFPVRRGKETNDALKSFLGNTSKKTLHATQVCKFSQPTQQ